MTNKDINVNKDTTTNKTLYSQADLKAERERLVKKQGGIDPIFKEPFKEVICVDHCHTTLHTRGALGRNSNAFEGLVFNAYRRCLAWQTGTPLSSILRNLADYLEQDFSKNPFHTSFSKALRTRFNALKEQDKEKVLLTLSESLGEVLEPSSNGKERKKKFDKLVLDRRLGYCAILQVINDTKSKSS